MSTEAARERFGGYPAPPKMVKVTPEMATKWLEANTHNRPINQGDVDRYARDMKAGLWMLTHQGIAFDTEGTLVDGQHRLWAIIDSGATVPMLVHYGLPVGTQIVIDTGRLRTTAHRLSLSDRFGEVTATEATTLKWLIKGAGKWPKMTVQEEQDLFAKYRDKIGFAVSAFPGTRRGITVAPVYAVIARASFREDHEKLRRFCYVLFSGEKRTADENVIITLREALIASLSGGMKPIMIYLKAENALRLYLAGKNVQKIFPASEEMWPLPGEAKLKVSFNKKNANKVSYDGYDRLMAHKKKTPGPEAVSAIAKLLGRSAHHTKVLCDHAVRLGWLKSQAGKSGRHNVTLYSLGSFR